MLELLYIDDELGEARNLQQLLRMAFDVYVEAPPENPTGVLSLLARTHASCLLLDFDMARTVHYDAPTIAALVRSTMPELPIVVFSGVLFSTKGDANKAAFQSTRALFDWTIDKNAFARNSSDALREIASIIHGYKTITHTLERRRSLRLALEDIVGASQDSTEVRAQMYAELKDSPKRALPPLIAHFLTHTLLSFSGPLLPLPEAAVALGIDPSSVSKAMIVGLDKAKYRGAFDDLYGQPRYWAGALAEVTPPTRGVKRAECSICGGPADSLCAVCSEPVDGIHSLGAVRSGAPKGFENVRVCGTCLDGELPGHLVIPQHSISLIAATIRTCASLTARADNRKR